MVFDFNIYAVNFLYNASCGACPSIFITLEQFFTGNHLSLEQPYSPMTIRFFILSAHYRGTVDFSNDALKASQKGMQKLMDGLADIERIAPQAQSDSNVHDFVAAFRQKRQASRSRTPRRMCVEAQLLIFYRSKVKRLRWNIKGQRSKD